MQRKGIYGLLNDCQVVYIGQSKDMIHRIGEHIAKGDKDFDSFDMIEIPDGMPADVLRKRFEAWDIKHLKPKYNVDRGITWGFEETDEEIQKLREMHMFLNMRKMKRKQGG